MTASISVIPVPANGAEDVVVASSGPDEGCAFTGTEDGGIWRVAHDGSSVHRVASTGGRPLGLELLPDGRLLVCDARRGVLRVDPATGRSEAVVEQAFGRPMRFTNNAAVHSSGDVFFSDSSLHYGIDHWKDDFVQDTRSGRLFRLKEGGGLSVVLEGLAFANGVALAADESYVVVAETAARTLCRLWLTGDHSGQIDFLAEDLPGYPDNIARGSDGLVWVTIASPTDPVVEMLHSAPLIIRKQVTKIPERLQPAPKRTVRVQAYDDAGTLVHDLEVDTPDYHMVTGVREHDGRVWVGSLHEAAVAVIDT
ncbi:SMP-30/gluconolactonase/LRE family protein [Nocardioides sp.]|uniref:SMP-30/gluconolactonase/LRE family protein n=1 Tax=Nocardioides sp. TaxID=35761 RepID=UPI00352733B7